MEVMVSTMIYLLVIFGVLFATVQSKICYTSKVSSSKTTRIRYRIVYQPTYTTYSCGFFWLDDCTRSYSTSYRQSYVFYYSMTSYSAETQCCLGYNGHPPLCQAICSGGCLNGGTCSSPGVCTCAPGWTGNNCEKDINECSGDHECDQVCINTAGSFVCSCIEGYLLQDDGRTCEDEKFYIDECADTNGDCQDNCTNTIGSYLCTCGGDYIVSENYSNCSTAAAVLDRQSDRMSEKSNILPAAISGGVAGAAAVLAMLVSVILIIVLRRKQRRSNATGTLEANEPNDATLAQPAEDTIKSTHSTFPTEAKSKDNVHNNLDDPDTYECIKTDNSGHCNNIDHIYEKVKTKNNDHHKNIDNPTNTYRNTTTEDVSQTYDVLVKIIVSQRADNEEH